MTATDNVNEKRRPRRRSGAAAVLVAAAAVPVLSSGAIFADLGLAWSSRARLDAAAASGAAAGASMILARYPHRIRIASKSGTIEDGDAVSVTLNGSTVTHTFSGDTDAAGVASALADEVATFTEIASTLPSGRDLTMETVPGEVPEIDACGTTDANGSFTLDCRPQRDEGSGWIAIDGSFAPKSGYPDCGHESDRALPAAETVARIAADEGASPFITSTVSVSADCADHATVRVTATAESPTLLIRLLDPERTMLRTGAEEHATDRTDTSPGWLPTNG